ncbi:hypothetical protein D3C87_1293440 [compost metagenome]
MVPIFFAPLKFEAITLLGSLKELISVTCFEVMICPLTVFQFIPFNVVFKVILFLGSRLTREMWMEPDASCEAEPFSAGIFLSPET